MSQLVVDIRHSLVEHIKNDKKTQTAIAREIGISGTALSQFLAGNYTGDNAAIAQKAQQLLGMREARKRLANSPPICLELNNTVRVLTATKLAHEARHMTLIHGSAGCSKTTSLKHYTENVNEAIYVEMDATISSQRSVLMVLLEELKEKPRNQPTTLLMRRILSLLRDTNKLLIIDECQHLNERAFDTIRAINDKADIGIVLSGNHSVLKRMFGRMEQEYDQLFSRFGEIVELENHYRTDEILSIYKGFSVDNECITYLSRVANQKGGLRRMDKQFKMAVNIADTLEQPLSLSFLKEAEKRLTVIGRVM